MEATEDQISKRKEACKILKILGMPKTQYNERAGRTFVALLDIKPETPWSEAKKRPMTVHNIIDFIKEFYGAEYQENTRESFRRFTLHQFIDAGLVIQNEDDPGRPTNSQDNNYRISDDALAVITKYGTPDFEKQLDLFIKNHGKLIEIYEKIKNENKIPLNTEGETFLLSPGEHNQLEVEIVEYMKPIFFKEAKLLYLGDTANKTLKMEDQILKKLGVSLNQHDKLPDIIYYDDKKNVLFLIEAVTSHGPVSPKRKKELEATCQNCYAKRVYISAFPNAEELKKHMNDIAWESEVWLADNPKHMIHFNGTKFLFVIDDAT